MVNAEKPDLVILDLMMPEIPGMEVCRMIRRQEATAALPIIMLTAKSDPVDKILGLEIGADDYITKPFHVRELIARVRAVLQAFGAAARTTICRNRSISGGSTSISTPTG